MFHRGDMAEYHCYRLMTDQERNWELFKNRNLIRRLGWKNWEYLKNAKHATLMQLFDEFTLHLETNGASQLELQARRLLMVELRIQHLDIISEVFQMHYNDITN